MSISTILSFWGGSKLTGSGIKLLVFILSALLGIVLFPLLVGVLSTSLPEQEQLMVNGGRQQFLTEIGGVIAMAWFGMWRLPKIIARQS
jgi:hypothetical protein